jgi:hypothetical protein
MLPKSTYRALSEAMPSSSSTPVRVPLSIGAHLLSTKSAAPKAPFVEISDAKTPSNPGFSHFETRTGTLADDLNDHNLMANCAGYLADKAAAVLGPLALQALGEGAPPMTGPNVNGDPPIPIVGNPPPSPAAAQAAQIPPPIGMQAPQPGMGGAPQPGAPQQGVPATATPAPPMPGAGAPPPAVAPMGTVKAASSTPKAANQPQKLKLSMFMPTDPGAQDVIQIGKIPFIDGRNDTDRNTGHNRLDAALRTATHQSGQVASRGHAKLATGVKTTQPAAECPSHTTRTASTTSKQAAALTPEQQALMDKGHGKKLHKCGHTTQCRCSHGGELPVQHLDTLCDACHFKLEKLAIGPAMGTGVMGMGSGLNTGATGPMGATGSSPPSPQGLASAESSNSITQALQGIRAQSGVRPAAVGNALGTQPAQGIQGLGGRNTPGTNPINSFGPISAIGDLNGNAGLGVKNSPVDTKNAAALFALAVSEPVQTKQAMDDCYANACKPADNEWGCTCKGKCRACSKSVNKQAMKYMSQLGDRTFTPGEDCAHCGASMEKGDKGVCNCCGHDYDTGKDRKFGKEDLQKQARVVPLPRWEPPPPPKAFDLGFLNQPGVRNFMQSLGLTHDDEGYIKQASTQKQAAWTIPGLAGAKRVARQAFSSSALQQTGIGAGLGAAVGAGELLSGAADPNMSPEGQAKLVGANMAVGAFLGNPAARRKFFYSRGFAKRPTGGLAPQHTSSRQFNSLRALGLGSVGLGIPTLTNLGDSTSRFSRMAQEMLQDPEKSKIITNPTAAVKDIVGNATDRAATAAGNSPAAQVGTQSFGNSLGGMVGGGLAGNVLSKYLGKAVAGDDETLPYQSRRRREMARNVISLLGTSAGSIGGVALANHFNPVGVSSPNLPPAVAPKTASADNSGQVLSVCGQKLSAAPVALPVPVNPRIAAGRRKFLQRRDRLLAQYAGVPGFDMPGRLAAINAAEKQWLAKQADEVPEILQKVLKQ